MVSKDEDRNALRDHVIWKFLPITTQLIKWNIPIMEDSNSQERVKYISIKITCYNHLLVITRAVLSIG